MPDINHPEVPKEPLEIIPFEMDLVDEMPSGEVISQGASSVTVTDLADGSDQTATLNPAGFTATGTKMTAKIQSGSLEHRYRIRFICITTPSVYRFHASCILRIVSN